MRRIADPASAGRSSEQLSSTIRRPGGRGRPTRESASIAFVCHERRGRHELKHQSANQPRGGLQRDHRQPARAPRHQRQAGRHEQRRRGGQRCSAVTTAKTPAAGVRDEKRPQAARGRPDGAVLDTRMIRSRSNTTLTIAMAITPAPDEAATIGHAARNWLVGNAGPRRRHQCIPPIATYHRQDQAQRHGRRPAIDPSGNRSMVNA